MQVTSTQTYLFRAEGKEDFVLPHSEKGEIRVAPDWIGDTELFKLAESDGSIKEVSVKSPAPKVVKPEDPKPDLGLK
jgi:hypothetical protein